MDIEQKIIACLRSSCKRQLMVVSSSRSLAHALYVWYTGFLVQLERRISRKVRCCHFGTSLLPFYTKSCNLTCARRISCDGNINDVILCIANQYAMPHQMSQVVLHRQFLPEALFWNSLPNHSISQLTLEIIVLPIQSWNLYFERSLPNHSICQFILEIVARANSFLKT